MREETITYPGKDRDIEAYVVYPEGPGPHPAMVVLMEIWGVDDHIREVARRFAQQGYVSIAPDLYTGPFKEAMKPDNIRAGMMFLRQAPPEIQRDPSKMADALASRSPEEQTALKTLMQIMSAGQRASFAEEVVGAVDYLKSLADVDKSRIASLGFCFGGGLSGNLATLVPDLWKAVIFYGENPPLERVGNIHAQILGLYGGKDPRITDLVPDLQRAMTEADKPFAYKVYGWAQHAFFNNTRPSFDAKAADDAWHEVLRFLHTD